MSRMLAALDEMNVSHTVVTSGESFAKFNSTPTTTIRYERAPTFQFYCRHSTVFDRDGSVCCM